METTDQVNDDYELHPLSTILPAMSADDFKRLKGSIATRGFLKENPIVLYEGRILDGQHRYRACSELGIEPLFRDFVGSEPQALALVLANNTDRRHLTKAQIAQTIVNSESLKPAAARATTAQIAEMTGCTADTVRQAIRLRDEDSALATAVATGKEPATRAARAVGLASKKLVGARVVGVNVPVKLYNQIVDVAAADNGKTAIEWIKKTLKEAVTAHMQG